MPVMPHKGTSLVALGPPECPARPLPKLRPQAWGYSVTNSKKNPEDSLLRFKVIRGAPTKCFDVASGNSRAMGSWTVVFPVEGRI